MLQLKLLKLFTGLQALQLNSNDCLSHDALVDCMLSAPVWGGKHGPAYGLCFGYTKSDIIYT
jgi:hypothetical protein